MVEVDYEVVQKPSFRPAIGALIAVQPPEPKEIELIPDAAVQFQIVFEDESLLVIDKPAGLVVHPSFGHEQGTLVNGLLHHLGKEHRELSESERPGIIHRLDKDTSGLMVVAKTEAALSLLSAQFLPPRSIKRRYLALVCKKPGAAKDIQGSIDLPIGRHQVNRKKMGIRLDGGKSARTDWKLVEEYSCGALLELSLWTGRTHQIRVHLQAVDAPILGDPLYGPGSKQLPEKYRREVARLGRQALHAWHLSFIHPKTEEQVEFNSDLPADIEELKESLTG